MLLGRLSFLVEKGVGDGKEFEQILGKILGVEIQNNEGVNVKKVQNKIARRKQYQAKKNME